MHRLWHGENNHTTFCVIHLPWFYQFPTWLQRCYSGVTWRKDPSSKVLYLTFDDGPIPECTPHVLDILSAHDIKATFFIVGDNAVKYPELLDRILEEGHMVGNHTFRHLRGIKTSTAAYLSDVKMADSVLHSPLFRPPHGRMRLSQKRALLQAGYQIYLWDVLTHDYNPAYSVENMLEIVQRYVRNGSIITCHDSLKSRDRLLCFLPMMIVWCKEQGYSFERL